MNQHDQQHTESPEMLSLMGYSLAKDAGQFRKGIELCLKALTLDPSNCDHYLYLGRVYRLANKEELAIQVFEKGLKIRKDARILEEIRLLSLRRPPLFASLPRDHGVNRVADKILHTLTFLLN